MTREEKIAKIQAAERQLKIDKIKQAEKMQAMAADEGMVADELETFGKSAADAAILGYSPQLVGLYEALTSEVPYVEARDKYAQELKMLQQMNPVSSALGTAAGIGGTLLVPGGALARAGKVGATVAKMSPVAKAALSGAAMGAAYNPGDVEGQVQPLQLPERAVGATIGGVTGGVLAKAIPYAGEQLSKAGKWATKKAREKAFEALGPNAGQVKRYAGRIEELGQEVFDKGLLKLGPASKKTLLKRAEKQSRIAGEKIGQITDDLVRLEDDIGKIDKQSIANKLRDKLVDFTESGDPLENKYFERRINAFLNSGDKAVIGAQKAQEVKSKAGNRVNWKRLLDTEGSRANRFDATLSDELGQALLNKADDAAAAGANISKKALQEARNSYRNLAPIKEILETSAAKQTANLGLTALGNTIPSVLGGSLGYGVGDEYGAGLGTVAGATLGMLNRRYGAATAAQLARAAAPALQRMGAGVGALGGALPVGLMSTQVNPLTGYESLLERRSK